MHERELVDASGARVRFPGLARGQVALVAFVYGSCHEATGCPASLALLRDLDRRLAADPARARRVRLACVSFDPARDTPEKLAELRALMAPQGDWRFLVPENAAQLAPLLREFGQDVAELQGGAKRHVAKVYLVDAALRVRNIYAPGLLDPALVLADIDTLTAPAR
ncbi:MAG TPA: SCO family protein [Myxococcota bacterium]|nr:SCO family protein [Myxococcota bacterium]